MIRDYERVTRQVEAVIDQLNDAASKGEAISIANACKQAHVNEAFLYRILNNIEEYKISDELLERLENARDNVLSVILQRLDEIAEGRIESAVVNGIVQDSGLNVARTSLMLKNMQWKLKNMLPKQFSEQQQSNNQLNINSNNRYNVLLTNMSNDQLKALASMQLLGDQSNEQ